MHLSRVLASHLRSVAVSSAGALCVLACTGLVTAQKAGAGRPTKAVSTSRAAAGTPSAAVTFAAMSQAVQQQDYTVEQLRRFPDGQGQVITVRERLSVDANGAGEPAFELTFLGVEGELPGSPAWTKWQHTYQSDAALFHKHGSFGVRDLGSIQQNYSLHEFGSAVRANRTAVRTVVFPQTSDKSIWVVDVDASTMVPLYWAEYDFQFRLLSEVEAVTFSDSVVGPPPAPTAAGTVQHADFASAKAFLGDPPGVVDLPLALVNYGVTSIETRDDPLNGQQKLVTTYTDGVDEFVVVQVPGTADLFASLTPPAKDETSSGAGHRIARFHDASLRVLLFWDDGVSFQVAGRGSLTRLDGAAKQLYLQALSTN